jgi:hypothetical protein
MPQMILRIEDLSVENVQAQLPPAEEMLPPVRTVPLLSEGELAVGEPTIPAAEVESGGPTRGGKARALSTDVQLGVGTTNMILGNVALTTLGPDPRLSLQFHHESLDGFDGHAPGSGFSVRDDDLDGGLKFRLGGMDTDLEGGFKENEAGLQQQQAEYSSVLSRAFSGSASFSGSLTDWLTLGVEAIGGYDSLTLQANTPASSYGLRLSPEISAQAHFGAVKVGLETHYWYRSDSYLLDGEDQLQRIEIDSDFSLELPATLVLQARAGWFGNSAGLSLVPLCLAVTGTPLAFLTLSVEGGYKVIPYDMDDIISSNTLAETTPLVDDRGWYGEATGQISLTRDLAVTLKGQYMGHEAMPVGSVAIDPATGLFPVAQTTATQLSGNAGLRWGITKAFSVSAGWDHEFMDRPFFTPIDAITAGLIGLDPNGRFGGSLTMELGPIYDGTFQDPVLHISGFWKIIETVKLQLDGDDLLAPLLDGPRWNIARNTYITPGFRIFGSLSVSL